jgi:hypothetical protein
MKNLGINVLIPLVKEDRLLKITKSVAKYGRFKLACHIDVGKGRQLSGILTIPVPSHMEAEAEIIANLLTKQSSY